MRSYAVQLYTLRDHLAADPTATLTRLAALGYEAVEPFDLTPVEGFEVPSAHAPLLGPNRDDYLKVADTLIVPMVRPEEFTTEEGIRRTADALNAASAWGAGHGVTVGYHNHHWELASRVGGRPALEVLADLLDPAVVLEVDVYWAAVGGADVPALLGRLGERVRFLHVKDGPATLGEPMTAVGSGTLPIPDILAAAPQARRVVELDSCATDIFDALADSLAYLREVEGR
ncbi:sugar phosphate isomerase/epimerase family protein [Nonomuraea africana]|uniref:Sugar phosphate isomerase/epimerase n=1 Tax=Nonomuraea africana TaxID=46171 RepID=A0ABR9KBN5_9ACTN|nr:sugar phosphate isomerase/epimerase [Nonomuraea africana]MBE1559429.1 sugar phosphate isomerase/epimerase [Nonomuraea africana]